MSRWDEPGGYRQVLQIGLPMVMSMMSHSVMQFTDRIFLGHYSINAIAASLPASITSFLFISFFMGVSEYLSVFVAQYTGAVRPERVGASLWQGIWFCVPASILLALLALAAPLLFRWGGHPVELQALEISYFRVLTMGGGLVVLSTTLSTFFSGRGMTVAVMLVNMAGAAVNIPLDYVLINGLGWFPEMGIIGAGVATVTGSGVMVVLFAVLIFTRENNERFQVRTNWRLDRVLFWRYMKFGLPGGVNFFVDMFAVTFFVFMVGRIGGLELAATNMVISLDLMIFLPGIGLGFATGVLVGQYVGSEEPELGFRASRRAIQICVTWMGVMGLTFLLIPDVLMGLFKDRSMSVEQFATIVDMGTQMLRYVAVYAVLDGIVLIYFGALKGAGDVKFVMWSMVCCSVICMVLPITLLVNYTDLGFHGPWICLTGYVAVLTAISWIRFRGGAWTRMRVIEKQDGLKAA